MSKENACTYVSKRLQWRHLSYVEDSTNKLLVTMLLLTKLKRTQENGSMK